MCKRFHHYETNCPRCVAVIKPTGAAVHSPLAVGASSGHDYLSGEPTAVKQWAVGSGQWAVGSGQWALNLHRVLCRCDGINTIQ